jgi:hypothetical protein
MSGDAKTVEVQNPNQNVEALTTAIMFGLIHKGDPTNLHDAIYEGFSQQDIIGFAQERYAAASWHVRIRKDINTLRITVARSEAANKYAPYTGGIIIAILAAISALSGSISAVDNSTVKLVFSLIQIGIGIAVMIIKGVCDGLISDANEAEKRLRATRDYIADNPTVFDSTFRPPVVSAPPVASAPAATVAVPTATVAVPPPAPGTHHAATIAAPPPPAPGTPATLLTSAPTPALPSAAHLGASIGAVTGGGVSTSPRLHPDPGTSSHRAPEPALSYDGSGL